MVTIDTLTSQLDEALNINQVETTFSRDYQVDLINQQRVLWMRNEYNKNKRSIDPNVIQDLRCIEMEVVNSAECCGEVIPVGCKILRSKEIIPNSIEFYSSKALTDIGPVDIIAKRFNFVNYKRIEFLAKPLYGKAQTYVFLYNRRLYMYSLDERFLMIEKIKCRGVFEDPLEVMRFNKCGSLDPTVVCENYEEGYPLNMWMWEYMKPIIVEQMMRKQLTGKDEMNDSQDVKA